MSRPLGIYLHFPFCERKCAYCDFPSYAGQGHQVAAYIRALCDEITRCGEKTGPLTVDTIYVGGGTPSLMAPGHLRAVLGTVRRAFHVLPEAEISCEINPGTLKAAFLDAFLTEGGNRLSLGAQSAHPEELAALGRIHTWEQVEDAVGMAVKAGIHNLNLDLMSALPGQTWPRLQASLKAALALPLTHLSCYSLIIEEGTPFYALHQAGKLDVPDEDTERQLVKNTVKTLEEAGFPQYEISNFAKPGFACRHNLNCWQYHDYLGFGCSAASLFKGQRQKNPDSLWDYLKGAAPLTETLSPKDERFEMLMLGLRTRQGLSLPAFRERFGLGVDRAWPNALKRQLAGGLLKLEGDFLRLSEAGFDLMDRALLDFLPD